MPTLDILKHPKPTLFHVSTGELRGSYSQSGKTEHPKQVSGELVLVIVDPFRVLQFYVVCPIRPLLLYLLASSNCVVIGGIDLSSNFIPNLHFGTSSHIIGELAKEHLFLLGHCVHKYR